MLKVAIIGCGRIADQHIQQIQRIQGCEVVGACDLEPLMATQLCERFQIKHAFSDVTQLLETCSPQVVHITTPPQSHFPIAKECFERGSHVYVEKPFTLNTKEAQDLIDFANASKLKLTVGHDLQFTHVSRRMRQLVTQGYLGGLPNHMESYYCYEHADATYAKAILGDAGHWVRRLPGQLLHNIISHGIARIAEFLPGDSPHVAALGFVSPFLKSIGEHELVDELRVTISDEDRTTAYFTFSSQMRPALNLFRLYGSKNGIELDPERETLIKLRGDRFKSYVEKFVPPLNLAAQQLGNVATNLQKFLRNDFHMKSGMKHLIESFYHSIVNDGPPPIPYREIRLTSWIMDTIFDQLNAKNIALSRKERQPAEASSDRLLPNGGALQSIPTPGAGYTTNRQ
jgi:predicted dehydrogenase